MKFKKVQVNFNFRNRFLVLNKKYYFHKNFKQKEIIKPTLMKYLAIFIFTILICSITFSQENLNDSLAPEQVKMDYDFDVNKFSALQFRNIGPFRGGRSNAVSGIIGDPMTYYFGSTGGGVWKTEDAV